MGCVTCILLAGCGEDSPTEVPVIGHGGEYTQALAKAEELSKVGLEKINRDEELTAEDKQNLVAAASQFQGLVRYQPNLFAPYLALGMIERGLGNLEAAERDIKQCLLNIPASNEQAIQETAAEAHYQLSRVYFDQGKYDISLAEASTASETVDNNPNYLVGQASALAQLNRIPEAKKLLAKALKLDPEHRRAKGLNKLLNRPAGA